ncbi:vacuolar-sorting receptor 6-like protein [Tanacetum coccineum]
MSSSVVTCIRGRVCECPSINEVQYQGDGYTSCEVVVAGRYRVNIEGCWSDIRDGHRFSACSMPNITGCSYPQDVEKCKEGIACRCDGVRVKTLMKDMNANARETNSSNTKATCNIFPSHDMTFPYVGVEQWLAALNLGPESPWVPFYVDTQVGRYEMTYAHNHFSMTYATIKADAEKRSKSLGQRADAMTDVDEECKKVLDAVENICPQGIPDAFVDIRLQEIFELLLQLWTLGGSGGESFWEEGDDFGVDVLRFHTCLTNILSFLEKLEWWFGQDIDNEEEEDEEGEGSSEIEEDAKDGLAKQGNDSLRM